jgi:hypothetical protein
MLPCIEILVDRSDSRRTSSIELPDVIQDLVDFRDKYRGRSELIALDPRFSPRTAFNDRAEDGEFLELLKSCESEWL